MRDARWHARRLIESPHRLGFSAAAVLLVFASLWWLAWLLARRAGVAWPWAVAPGLVHGLLFGFGFMPLFFAGFLFTAGPKWLRLPPVDVRDLRRPVAAQVAGWLVVTAGGHVHAGLAALGLMIAALAWLALVRRLAELPRRSPLPERVHLRSIVAAGALGGAIELAAAVALVLGHDEVVRAALQLGLWGFVAPVFIVALHRMLPVFDEEAAPRLAARRPHWLLATLVSLCLLQWPFALADLWWWPQPAAWRALQIVVDGAAALLVLALVARWLRLQGLRLKLLVMLQVSIAWLGIAFAMATLSQALLWSSGGTLALGLASQHAFSMGFLGGVMVAMVTRVASAQAGRSIAADTPAWALFLMLQVAVLLRIAAALGGEPVATLLLAALAFAGAMVLWAMRLIAWQGRSGLAVRAPKNDA